ncbi:MAG: SpoIID/LytB domain-containing protein [Synergistes sp.]|nr:SpoIID/LytB domain-containing protein [Synergistes sp.]
MKKLLLLLLLLCYMSGVAEAHEIAVLLEANAPGCSIAGTDFVLRVGDGGVTPPITGIFSVAASGNCLAAGSVTYLLPVTVTSPNPVVINGISYYGNITFEQNSKGVNIINNIDLEDYLKGVIPIEMNPAWNVEALKAQAVLARTYTLLSKRHGKYDICSASHCQVYKGITKETDAVRAAVEDTKGEILTSGGNTAQIYYFADSGGVTASNRSVFGKEIPYLQSKNDPVEVNYTGRNWKASFTMQQISGKLAAAKLYNGSVDSLRIAQRDESGRVSQLEISGTAGTKLISGTKFRSAIGAAVVKSTLFSFGTAPLYAASTAVNMPVTDDTQSSTADIDESDMPQNEEDILMWMSRNRIFSASELVSMLGKTDKYPEYIAEGKARMKRRSDSNSSAAVQTADNRSVNTTALNNENQSDSFVSGTEIEICGAGYGHGVGMPQWTAKAMADAGWTYRQILDYYFPGTTVERGN